MKLPPFSKKTAWPSMPLFERLDRGRGRPTSFHSHRYALQRLRGGKRNSAHLCLETGTHLCRRVVPHFILHAPWNSSTPTP